MRTSSIEATWVDYELGDGRNIEFATNVRNTITPYTHFLLARLPDVRGRDVLDFGAGCGALGVVAALCGARRVVAADISEEALDLTGVNAQHHRLTNFDIVRVERHRETQVITPHSFDVVLCNPASLPTLIPGQFWSGGPRGTDMILTLIDTAHHALRPGGLLCFVHTSLAALADSTAYLARNGMAAGIVAVQRIPFRAFYEPLFEYFAGLRSAGHIFFDGARLDDSFEYLYLVEAHLRARRSQPTRERRSA